MCEPDQQTWDLSPNDVEAIRMAVRVLSVIEEGERSTLVVINSLKKGKIVAIGATDRQHQGRGDTWLEAYSAAGRLLNAK